jgi:hypothetical protein
MRTELTLFDEFDDELMVRWRAFHNANPHVWRRLVEIASGLSARGHRQYGMKALFEVLRYERALSTSDPTSTFKLNNDYAAVYAREIMRLEPSLAGFFTTRRSKLDD